MKQINIQLTDKERQLIDAYGGPTAFKNRALETLGKSSGITNDKGEEIPAFLFTTEATNEEIFAYLKNNPQYSEFIYKTYTKNQPFIMELCDPASSLHLSKVREYLQDTLDLDKEKEKLSGIQSEIRRMEFNRDNLKDDIDVLEEKRKDQKKISDENEKRIKEISGIIGRIGGIEPMMILARIRDDLKSYMDAPEDDRGYYRLKPKVQSAVDDIAKLVQKISAPEITGLDISRARSELESEYEKIEDSKILDKFPSIQKIWERGTKNRMGNMYSWYVEDYDKIRAYLDLIAHAREGIKGKKPEGLYEKEDAD